LKPKSLLYFYTKEYKNVFGFRKEVSTQVKKPKPIGAFNEKVSTNVDVEPTFYKQKECP
jgi:hypothetical protein